MAEFVTHLSEGPDDGALHDAFEEDEVNIFGSCAWWQVFQVVQDLLHGWREKIDARIRRREYQPLSLLLFELLKYCLMNAGRSVSDKEINFKFEPMKRKTIKQCGYNKSLQGKNNKWPVNQWANSQRTSLFPLQQKRQARRVTKELFC